MENNLQIDPIAAFDDNYIWLLHREGHDGCVVVDPGDEDPVIETLRARGLRLEAILITHKHGDHVGGIEGLKAVWPDAVVYGPANEPIRNLDHTLGEGDRVTLSGLGLELQVMDVPGHTEGHIAYYSPGILFCGDTLFAGGCGRVFSGTFAQLSAAMLRIGSLPGDTQVYCAHEYTADNLGFAQWVEPENAALSARVDAVAKARQQLLPTVPSCVADELQTNPFMRIQQPAVIEAAQKWADQKLDSPAAVFEAVRTWKDREYD